MLENEALFAVADLNIIGKIDHTDEDQLNEYIRALNFFIDGTPDRKKVMQNILTQSSLSDRDISQLKKHLNIFYGKLVVIHADKLAQDCQEILKGIDGTHSEDFKKFLHNFLARLSMLSIDIQMALKNPNCIPTTDMSKDIMDKKIVAVDDRPFFLNVLKQCLRGTDYRLTTFNCSLSALEHIDDTEPDLFILDIEMPKMDGYELAKRIKKKGHTAPIIFFTGCATKENVAKALQAGAADFIIKTSITKEQVLARITKHI